MRKIFILFVLITFLNSCGGSSKEGQVISPPNSSEEAIKIYKEALDGMFKGNYLYASKKFSEAEGMLPQIDWASKSALMSSYCLYNINFYDEAVLNLERFIRIYPTPSKPFELVNTSIWLFGTLVYPAISSNPDVPESVLKNMLVHLISRGPSSTNELDPSGKVK